MHSRRRYGLWDRIALDAEHRIRLASPRLVPALGRRHRWINRARATQTRQALASGGSRGNWVFAPYFLAMFLPATLMDKTPPLFRVAVIIALAVMAALLTIRGMIEAYTHDPRHVLLRRRRERLLADAPSWHEADILQYRRAFWLRELAYRRFHTQFLLASCSAYGLPVMLLPIVLIAGVLALSLVPTWAPILRMDPIHAALSFAPPVVVLFLMGPAWWSIRRCKRVHRSLIENNCPECDYPQPSGVRVVASDGKTVEFGPRACPECGEPWPRIPPDMIGR